MYNKSFIGGLAAALDRKFGAPKGYRVIHRLNRSQHWRRANSYKHAREISPFPDRPVR